MRTYSCILVLVGAAVANYTSAAESSDFVLHKNADGTHDFMKKEASKNRLNPSSIRR